MQASVPSANECLTNDERASWGEIALLAFGQKTGLLKERIGDNEDPFFIISDLLADLAIGAIVTRLTCHRP